MSAPQSSPRAPRRRGQISPRVFDPFAFAQKNREHRAGAHIQPRGNAPPRGGGPGAPLLFRTPPAELDRARPDPGSSPAETLGNRDDSGGVFRAAVLTEQEEDGDARGDGPQKGRARVLLEPYLGTKLRADYGEFLRYVARVDDYAAGTSTVIDDGRPAPDKLSDVLWDPSRPAGPVSPEEYGALPEPGERKILDEYAKAFDKLLEDADAFHGTHSRRKNADARRPSICRAAVESLIVYPAVHVTLQCVLDIAAFRGREDAPPSDLGRFIGHIREKNTKVGLVTARSEGLEKKIMASLRASGRPAVGCGHAAAARLLYVRLARACSGVYGAILKELDP